MAEKRSKKRPRGKGRSNAELAAAYAAGVAGAGGVAGGARYLIGRGAAAEAAAAAAARQAAAGQAAAQAVRQAGTGRVTSGVIPMGNTRLSGGVRFPPSTYTPTQIPTQTEMFPTARPAPVIPETPVTLGNRPIPSTELVPYRGQNFEFAPRQSGFTGGNPGVLSGEPLGARMSGDPLLFGGRPSNAVSAAQNAGGIPETPVSLSNRIPETPVSLSNRIPETPVSIRPTPAPVPGTDIVPYKGQPNWEFGSKAGTPPSGGTGSVGPAASIADDVAAGAAGAGGEGAGATGLRGVWQAMKGGGLRPALVAAGEAEGAGKLAVAGAAGAGAIQMGAGIGTGLLTNYLVDKINIGGENSYLDKGISGAAAGAAGGAVMGGGYGALFGGISGGLLSVGSKYFGDKALAPQKAEGTFQDYAAFGTQYGVPADTMNQLQNQYTAAVQLGTIANGADEEGLAASEAKALESYSTAVASAVQGQLSGTSSQASGDATNAALQAVMTQYIQPYADQQIGSSMAYADQLEQYANQNPSLSAILRNQAAAERANGTRMAASLMTSARIEPYMQAAQNQQSSLAQQSQQIAAQAMQPQAAASASPASM